MMTDEEYIQHCYKYRPDIYLVEEDQVYPTIKIRTQFPKFIKKDTCVISAFGVASYDAMKEFYILKKILHKPLIVGATSGRWEGTPFLVYTIDDFFITLEDEKIIQDYEGRVHFTMKDELKEE